MVSGAPTVLFCAGAVKAGTTWLWDYLADHPEAHLRTIKELQYFDKLAAGTLTHRARRIGKEIDDLDAELAGGKARWPAWLIRQIADRVEYQSLLTSGPDPTAAYLRYLTAGATGKRLVADMTPEYGLLPPDRMRALARLLPDVRWVFLMRDPVSRLWSHVRMLVRRTKPAPEAFAAACATKFDDVLAGRAADVVARGDYAGIHARLVEAVAADKRLILFYEQLITPDGVARVCGFLGLSAHPAKLDKVVHEGVAVDMPEALRHRARDWLRPQYEFVARTFGLPAEWESFPGLQRAVA